MKPWGRRRDRANGDEMEGRGLRRSARASELRGGLQGLRLAALLLTLVGSAAFTNPRPTVRCAKGIFLLSGCLYVG
jgi:hypothetical protein